MTEQHSINTRELILAMLMEVDAGKEYSHMIIRSVLDKYNYIGARDKALIKRVTEGTIEQQIRMDYVINLYSKIPVHKMKPLIRSLLRMSTYQLLCMDSIPDSAVCNEAVKLAVSHKFHNLKGFVNGVLRTIARKKQEIPYPDKTDMTNYLSVRYSMPAWIVAMWRKEYPYPDDTTERMLAALLEGNPVTIRMDETLSPAQKAQCIAGMTQSGITVTEHPYLPYAYTLGNTEGIASIPGFAEGRFTVQDVSSMLAIQTAGVKQGDNIIDVCAAPGGKALHAACKLNDTGHVLARDISAYKTALIQEHIDRFHYKNIKAQVWDATVPDEALKETADLVIADLPCSGLGILGRKSDIKYNVTEASLAALTELQKQILTTIWQYVKPGGTLLYSTCTIHKAENENMAEWILQNLPFEPVSLDDCLPEKLHSETTAKGYLQLLPGVHAADGFFIAKFRRTE